MSDTEAETYLATVKCHDPNGELYNVTFSRERVNILSYSDDAIFLKVEMWGGTVPQME